MENTLLLVSALISALSETHYQLWMSLPEKITWELLQLKYLTVRKNEGLRHCLIGVTSQTRKLPFDPIAFQSQCILHAFSPYPVSIARYRSHFNARCKGVRFRVIRLT